MAASVSGKVAFVTGGASGIGEALTTELVSGGAEVWIADRQIGLAQELARRLSGGGARAHAIELDVRDYPSFERAVAEAVRQSGRIDYLFNNAGIGVSGEIDSYTLDDWNDVFDVNLRGVVHGIQAVYPVMIRQRSGHIVNTASMAGLTTTVSHGELHRLQTRRRRDLEDAARRGRASRCPGLRAVSGRDPDPDPHRRRVRPYQPARRQPRGLAQGVGTAAADGARQVRRAGYSCGVAQRRHDHCACLVEGVVVPGATFACIDAATVESVAQATAGNGVCALSLERWRIRITLFSFRFDACYALGGTGAAADRHLQRATVGRWLEGPAGAAVQRWWYRHRGRNFDSRGGWCPCDRWVRSRSRRHRVTGSTPSRRSKNVFRWWCLRIG